MKLCTIRCPWFIDEFFHITFTFFFNIFANASRIKDSRCKGCSGKEWENLEKIPAWQLTKVRNKKEVIDEARNKGRKVHLASLLGLCHLKNSELELQFQKYKGRVVLRGDIVKNDSVSYAVFTVQGSLPSQMTAANVMDNISRLPGCAGQAADAVSAKTQVKIEDAPKLFLKKFQSQNAQTFGYEVLNAIQRVRFTESTPRHASIRERKAPSLGYIQVEHRHQRSPYAKKFEDRSHEETERQQRCARSKVWNLAKNIYKLKEKDKATLHFPASGTGTPRCVNKRARGK